jgi:hypothetical protein
MEGRGNYFPKKNWLHANTQIEPKSNYRMAITNQFQRSFSKKKKISFSARACKPRSMPRKPPGPDALEFRSYTACAYIPLTSVSSIITGKGRTSHAE